MAYEIVRSTIDPAKWQEGKRQLSLEKMTLAFCGFETNTLKNFCLHKWKATEYLPKTNTVLKFLVTPLGKWVAQPAYFRHAENVVTELFLRGRLLMTGSNDDHHHNVFWPKMLSYYRGLPERCCTASACILSPTNLRGKENKNNNNNLKGNNLTITCEELVKLTKMKVKKIKIFL